jgi:hypothetical protein
MEGLYKIPLIKNTKKPPREAVGWNKLKNITKFVDINKYGIGLLTGSCNNFFVIDADYDENKDIDGITAINEYINEYGGEELLLTVTQKTPRNGIHYFMKLKSEDEEINKLIEIVNIHTTTHCRNVKIDVRAEGAYVVSAPSTYQGKKYVYIRDFNNYEVRTPSKNLILWLAGMDKVSMTKRIEDIVIKKEVKKSNIIKNNIEKYKYIITDEDIWKVLNILPEEYLNDYYKWLYIITVLKSLNKYEISDEWSKKSKKYNVKENLRLWEANKGCINIDDLSLLLKKRHDINISELINIKKYKLINYIRKDINFKKVIMNNKYLYVDNYEEEMFDYNKFINYDTIIIKSSCGSGKTHAIARHCKKFLGKEKKFILSIVTRKLLVDQHKETFGEFGIDMGAYDKQDDKNNIYCGNLAICINSILMYKNHPPEAFSEWIVVIDEVMGLISTLVCNELISDYIALIMNVLMRIIKNAHKVICSDNIITDNILNLLRNRDDNKKIYIENIYKKYNNIEAIEINDKNKFLNIMKDKIKNEEKFWLASNSASEATELYNECKKIAKEEEKDKFILITAKTDKRINNASEEFKDKWVFHSPKIIFGTSFSIPEQQDVFIIAKDNNTLMSYDILQQSLRTRNIKKIYFCCNIKEKRERFKDLETTKEYYKKFNNATDQLINTCMDMNGSDKINHENLYFDIFTEHIYMNDCFITNLKELYKNLLKESGFKVINSEDEEVEINKEDKERMKNETKEIEEDLFAKYLNETSNDVMREEYKYIRENLLELNLINERKEILEKYKKIIISDKEKNKTLDIIQIFNTADYNDNRIKDIEKFSYKIKYYKNINQKIRIIKNLENEINKKIFDIDDFNEKEFQNKEVKISDNLYKQIQLVFDTKRSIPKTMNDIGILYRYILKSFFGKEIFNIKKIKGEHKYRINKEHIKYYFDLYNYKKFNNLDEELFKFIE